MFETDCPIFVLGNPRSGTSLLRTIINSHDNIVIPPECGFIQWLQAKHGEFGATRDPDLIAAQLANFVDDLLQTRKIEGWHLDQAALLAHLSQQHPRCYAELCASVYYHYGNKTRKKLIRWGDKNNYYIHHLDELSELYPNAVFIHTVRNPKDVICSYREIRDLPPSAYKPNLPTQAVEIAHQWYENNSHIAEFLGNGSHRHLQIRHEDLLLEPESTVASIFDFIGLDASNVLANFESRKFHDEPAITIGWKTKLLQPIDKTSCNRYTTVLNEQQNREVDAYLAAKKFNFRYKRFE